MTTALGLVAVTLMVLTYTLEARAPGYVLAFAGACVLASIYGFLSGAWPFGLVEMVWAGLAVQRYRRANADSTRDPLRRDS